MPRKPRIFLTPFGEGGVVDDFAQFGSQRAAAPLKTKDILNIQGLAAWSTGWKNAINNANKAPFLEDMNALFLVIAYMQTYQFQEGIPEWDPNTEYFIGSIVKKPETDELYSSFVDSNTGNTLPNQISDANWRFLSFQDLPTRRARMIYNDKNSIDAEENSLILNTTRVVFPDANSRTVTEDLTVTEKYRRCRITNTANFTAGVESGGVRSGLAVVDNSWMALYAVKSQINTSNFVLVADDIVPSPANWATLNARYSLYGWVYLGVFRIGINDPSATLTASGPSHTFEAKTNSTIVGFIQQGNRTRFVPYQVQLMSDVDGPFNIYTIEGAVRLGSQNLTTGISNAVLYSYAAGMSAFSLPESVEIMDVKVALWRLANTGAAWENVHVGPSSIISSPNGPVGTFLISDTQTALNGTSDPLARKAIVQSTAVQQSSGNNRLELALVLDGLNANNQKSVGYYTEWIAKNGLRIYRQFGGNFPEASFSDAHLVGFKDKYL